MTNKIVIAKSGYDALTETNPDNLIFSSDYNTLKYDPGNGGNLQITVIGDGTDKSTEVSQSHGLGYVPFFAVYVNDFIIGTTKFYLCPFKSDTAGNTIRAESWADGTNLYFRLRNKSGSTYTATFYYKIFKNRLGL